MRGGDRQQGTMWSRVSPEDRVPEDHPLRPIREMVNGVLQDMSPCFTRIYAREGRPSIPPERLLRALLIQMLYTVRSERLLMEELDYNLLYRWFVGLNADDPVWNPTTFSKNRDRLICALIKAAGGKIAIGDEDLFGDRFELVAEVNYADRTRVYMMREKASG